MLWLVPLILFINVDGQELYKFQQKALNDTTIQKFKNDSIWIDYYTHLGLNNDNKPIFATLLFADKEGDSTDPTHLVDLFSLNGNNYILFSWYSSDIPSDTAYSWHFLTNINGVLLASAGNKYFKFFSVSIKSEDVKSLFIREKNYWLMKERWIHLSN